APYVDVVFGPQTLHRLPELLERRRSTGRPQVDISFPEIEKFDNLPPARVEGASAFVSIMEGCSKYCSFCVVPYTRGEEVSRPFDDVLAEVRHLAARGVKEVTLLGQNVNAYRGPMADGEIADFAQTLKLVDEVRFDGSFSFIYSARPGTPAANLPDPTPHAEKLARLHRLQARLHALAMEYSQAMVGSHQRVLVEGASKKDPGE